MTLSSNTSQKLQIKPMIINTPRITSIEVNDQNENEKKDSSQYPSELEFVNVSATFFGTKRLILPLNKENNLI